MIKSVFYETVDLTKKGVDSLVKFFIKSMGTMLKANGESQWFQQEVNIQ